MLMISLLSASVVLKAQAEFPDVIKKFVQINDKSKQIQKAKINKTTQVSVSKNSEDTIYVYSYDSNGKILKEYYFEEDSSKGPKTTFKDIHTYEYDSSGRVIQKIDSTGGTVVKTKIEYEDNGNISGENVYSNETLALEETFDYDDLSRLVECSGKNYSEDCKFVLNYVYDSYNNLAKIKSKSNCASASNSVNEVSFMLGYDKHGNIVSKNTISPNGLMKVETFKYDNKDKLFQSYESTPKEGYTEKYYTYDSLKNLVRIDISNVLGENIIKYSRTMKYDSNGNISEIQYLGNKNELINTIKYYYEYYR